jgi:hypothetical protein
LDERETAIERHPAVLLMVVDDFEWYNKHQTGSRFHVRGFRLQPLTATQILELETWNLKPDTKKPAFG